MEKNIRVTNVSATTLMCGPYGAVAPNHPIWVDMDFFLQYGSLPYLRFDFDQLADELRVDDGHGNLAIDWRSPLSMMDGYGIHAINVIRGLQTLGVDVAVRDAGWVDQHYLPPDIRAMRSSASHRAPAKIGVSFTVAYDQTLIHHDSPVKIGITQFETDTLPRKHVEVVNQLDHVVVTSSFGVKMFSLSGVRVPISVMNVGVDTDFYEYLRPEPDGLFKVLILGALSGRKNPKGAIRIFQQASDGNPDWRLTIKTRKMPGINEITAYAQGDSRIHVLTDDVSPEGVRDFYWRHDCLLWPSKGEGAGLPPLEAMSCGMEVVISDNTGMKDYAKKGHCYLIKNAGMETAALKEGAWGRDYVNRFGDVGKWYLPDEKDAARQLEKCFNNWREGKGRGAKAANYVRREHTLYHQAQSLMDVLEKYR